MCTPQETAIRQALKEESRTMQRQSLLKRLWKLERRRAAHNDNMTPSGNTAKRVAEPAH